MRTKYSTLTNEEFLRAIDDRKDYSPVIYELVKRLTNSRGDGYYVADGTNHNCECPVCEGLLLVGYDESNDRFELKGSEP